MRSKRILSLLVTALLILTSRSCSRGKRGVKEIRTRPIPVMVTTPRIGTIEKPIFLTAYVRGIREVKVYPDLPGKFQRFAVKQGEKVEKDTPILFLVRGIPGLNYPPVQVKAPVSGIVNLRPLEEGQYVTPQMPVATIFDTDSLRVIFHVPEKFAYNLKKGDWIKVKTGKGGWEKAKVIWKSSLLDQVSHTREVHAVTKSGDSALLPGAITEVEIPVVKRSHVLLIPANAILEEALPCVFVVKSGIAHKRVVKPGITNLKETEITEGLSEADTVVIRGQNLLKEGQPVAIKGIEGGKVE